MEEQNESVMLLEDLLRENPDARTALEHILAGELSSNEVAAFVDRFIDLVKRMDNLNKA